MLADESQVLTEEVRDELIFRLSEKVNNIPISSGETAVDLAAITGALEEAQVDGLSNRERIITLTRQFLETILEKSADNIPQGFRTGNNKNDIRLSRLAPESVQELLSDQNIPVEARLLLSITGSDIQEERFRSSRELRELIFKRIGFQYTAKTEKDEIAERAGWLKKLKYTNNTPGRTLIRDEDDRAIPGLKRVRLTDGGKRYLGEMLDKYFETA